MILGTGDSEQILLLRYLLPLFNKLLERIDDSEVSLAKATFQFLFQPDDEITWLF